MKSQKFGIEIEMTGITRHQAAAAIAKYFGNPVDHEGGSYDTRKVRDSQGRVWKIVSDASIKPQRGNSPVEETSYRVEFVSPVLEYSDIPTLQEVVRTLRKAGAKVNSSCGIHVHIDAAIHNANSLRNIINIMASKEDMLYKALQIHSSRASRWCKKVRETLVDKINRQKPSSLAQLADLWYEGNTDGRYSHYNSTRYSGLNLHNVWYRGTVEFRCFNSTLHAGEVKSYIQLALAVSHQALTQKRASATKTTSTNERFTFRTWLLRMGLIGDEFETARQHLLKHLEGDSAWRYGREQAAGF